MNINTKKKLKITILFVLLAGVAFYASMEDYQKENMSNFLSQRLSDVEEYEP